jgi:hypothetical protein
MKRQKQYAFRGKGLEKPRDWFGGSTIGNSKKTNPKTARPLSSKLPLHLVLRTDSKNSMKKPKAFGLVHRILIRTMKKHGVTLYDYSNVGSHLHVLLKIPHVNRWPAFIRELTGRLSQEMQGLKGQAKGVKYWANRPYTRIVQGWKKAFKIVKEYIHLNDLEAEGFISRKQMKRVADLRAFLGSG